MLFESDVVNAICGELKARGYDILQKLQTDQQGDDIVAARRTAPIRELFVEAKGETSSRRGSARFGKPFDSAQIRVHVAEALYKAVEVLSRPRKGVEVRAAIGLPSTTKHRALARAIAPVLQQLGVAVFWVEHDRSVEVDSPWQV